MNEERDLEKMYAKLERIHGDSIEEKAAEAHRKADQMRMSVEVSTDSNNNPLRINVAVGPHHFIEIGLVNGKVHVFKGETHHGTMYEAASVGSEWESVSSAKCSSPDLRFDTLPDDHQTVLFNQKKDDLALYYLRPGEE
jgi:hypothetical protein